jgi:hypothetical protein
LKSGFPKFQLGDWVPHSSEFGLTGVIVSRRIWS